MSALNDRTRRIIRADGTVEVLDKPMTLVKFCKAIGADCLATVNLRHLGEPLMVMVLDDLGHPKALPVNQLATQLYHANCTRGTTNTIRGDVAIVRDGDFGGFA
ncbi:MAG: hypothetical protein JWQ03_621 [Variovorax sp.]|nr:hypothetical protein [Variovorax sp.]